MTQITDTEICAACSELEDALLALLAERDDTHYDVAQDHLKALCQMADALLNTEDHADEFAGKWSAAERCPVELC